MEFSKKWLIGSAVSTALLLILYILQLIGAEIVLAAFAEVSVSGAFYFWKSKNENRAKYAQRFMQKWADKYGPETAARIAEIVLRE